MKRGLTVAVAEPPFWSQVFPDVPSNKSAGAVRDHDRGRHDGKPSPARRLGPKVDMKR